MTYSERMDLLVRSMHDLEIAANEYVQVCKSDCDENCDGCTRRVMWCYFVLMLVSGCFAAGWCLREHWEDLKSEVRVKIQKRSCKRGEKR